MRATKLAATFAVAVALAGCTSSPSPTEPPASASSAPSASASVAAAGESPSSAAAPAPAGDPLADAAARIGCTGWAQAADAAPYVDRWGECQLDGQRVQLYLVASDDAYRSFVQTVAGYGVTEAQLVHVGSVVAAPADQTKLDAVRAALGG